MDEHVGILAESAKKAAGNIVRLVAHVMSESTELARTLAFEEVQELILALLAAVLTADGVTTRHEFLFARLIAKDLDDPYRCRDYLQAYSQRWKLIADTTPRFFSTVLQYDVANKSSFSGQIIDELRNLVLFAANVDGEFDASEGRVAANLIARADGLFRQARWSVQWDEESATKIPLSSTVGRDEFPNRQIPGHPERREQS